MIVNVLVKKRFLFSVKLLIAKYNEKSIAFEFYVIIKIKLLQLYKKLMKMKRKKTVKHLILFIRSSSLLTVLVIKKINENLFPIYMICSLNKLFLIVKARK